MTSQEHKKGWGREVWIHNNPDYCLKRLIFDRKGARCSLHYHLKKSETFLVVKGEFRLDLVQPDGKRSGKVMKLHDWQNIPAGMPHRLTALKDDCEMVEASTQHFDNDSYRIEPGDSQKTLKV